MSQDKTGNQHKVSQLKQAIGKDNLTKVTEFFLQEYNTELNKLFNSDMSAENFATCKYLKKLITDFECLTKV